MTVTACVVAPVASSNSARWVAADVAVSAAGLAALVVWEASGLDIVVSRSFGGASGFAWRDHWLTAGVLHSSIRMLAWALLGALMVAVWYPLGALRLVPRADRWWGIVGVLASAGLVSLIKRHSATSCPWSLAEFGGGVAQYVPHWVLGITDKGPGGCFPSGHAATAFAFLATWFMLRDVAPACARRWLWATLLAGVLLGAVQVVRGAHYPSHSMWTAWLCWIVAAVLFHGRIACCERVSRRAKTCATPT